MRRGICLLDKQCDGQSPCARCATLNGLRCNYEVSVRVSKETLKADIEELQTYRQLSASILGPLATGYRIDFILRELRNGKGLENIRGNLGGQGLLVQIDSDPPSASDPRLSARSLKASTMTSTAILRSQSCPAQPPREQPHKTWRRTSAELG